MKILAFFIDMLGADCLNIGNSSAERTDMDVFFQKLGGTFYTNCYTPAPDTPRSTACMWTGLYPKANGCNNRLKYPGRFLKPEQHLWETLENKGYQFNVFLRRPDNEIGLLPKPYDKYAYYGNIENFLTSLELQEDSFTFLYLPDLHIVLDNYGYTKKALKKGTSLVAELLNKTFATYDKDLFDYIMIFSDHGFRYEFENREFLLDTDRVRTTMFIRRKGEKELLTDTRLCSTLDVYPTVCEMINNPLPEKVDGCSILSSEHSYVLLEDHEDFTVKLGQAVEHWGVVLDKGICRLECSGKWNTNEMAGFDELYWESLIQEKMDDYQENRKLWDALHIYDGNKVVSNMYSDGSLIKKNFRRAKIFILLKIIGSKITNILNFLAN